MDGLMFDTERLAMAAWDYAGEKLGVGKAGYMVMKTLGVTAERADEIWREEFGTDIDTEAMRRYGREFTGDFYEHNKVPVKPGLYELLDWLKSAGIKTAVASSSTRRAVDRNLLRLCSTSCLTGKSDRCQSQFNISLCSSAG